MQDFIININKPAGWTSFDVVAKLRGVLKIRKLGHTGTLDPDATGVLPVCAGKATKLVDYLTDGTKEYVAVMKLGVTTDTQDGSGKVIEVCAADGVTEEDVRRAALGFVGEIEQIPPMYSAVKVNGKKLYELARKGVEVERKPRRVTIHSIAVEGFGGDEVTMRIECSKGTYIRTLCADMGEVLGCGAHMKSLVRTRSGAFKIEDAVTINEVETRCKEDELYTIATPIETMLEGFAKWKVETGRM